MGITASVLGASGYAGAELLRVLARHPGISVATAAAERFADRPAAEAHPHLAGICDLTFVSATEALGRDADVMFSCLPSGELGAHLDDVTADVVVDLSDEHRAHEGWAYGLTEFNRAAIVPARSIANPGCYPTAVLLALVPFLRVGAVGPPVIVDAMSGVSGAGRKAEDRLLFAALDGSFGAYGTVTHRHVPEMEKYLADFSDRPVDVSFTPHLVPAARGLVATVRASLEGDLDDGGAWEILGRAYADEPFVDVVSDWPATKAVAGSNRALVSARVDARNGFLVAAAAIDNLGKGAAGQAVQNANVALGLPETTGLERVGVWP